MADRTASTSLSERSAPSSPTNAAAITNDPGKVRWDLKSSRGRRCRDLYRSCLRLIGNPPDAARQAQAITAAEHIVMAEVAREAALADPTDKKIATAIATEKAQRHALTALGIKKPGTEAAMSMAEQLAARGYVPPDDNDDDDDTEAGE